MKKLMDGLINSIAKNYQGEIIEIISSFLMAGTICLITSM